MSLAGIKIKIRGGSSGEVHNTNKKRGKKKDGRRGIERNRAVIILRNCPHTVASLKMGVCVHGGHANNGKRARRQWKT